MAITGGLEIGSRSGNYHGDGRSQNTPLTSRHLNLTGNALLVEVPFQSHGSGIAFAKLLRFASAGGPWENMGNYACRSLLQNRSILRGVLRRRSGFIGVGASVLRAGHSVPRAWIVSSVALVVRPTGDDVEQPGRLHLGGFGVRRRGLPNQRRCAPGCS